jgi:ATP/maltotriose-dependent transcriptional regulator MalT/DNA-binding SARP family transcriptional activator
VDTIARPALAARLASALDRGALLLVAPAGAGKTVALVEALERRGGDVAWVRCAPADHDPGRFLVHVLDALRSAVSGLATVLGDRLGAAAVTVDVGLAVGELEAELARLLVDPLTLVIDDAEHLEGAEQVAAMLLAADVARLRVAIATRRPLRLRAARLRAAGRLTELTAADLAFSAGECAELLRRRTGREPSDEEVDTLWTRTEGWPLGASLAASGDPADAPGSARALFDYLSEELLDPLEPDVRDRLIDSSVAPEPPEGFLGGVPLGHPLVREFLLARFQERPAERRAAMHASVAAALEASGRGDEAVDHWIAAGDGERAAVAIATHAPALAATAPATVASWLERLPPAARTGPELRLLEGRLALGAARLEEAIAPVRDAVAGFEAHGDEEAAWRARAVLSDVYVLQEELEPAVAIAEGFDATDAAAAPMVAMTAALALAVQGRFGEADELLARAESRPAAAPFAPLFAGFRGFCVELLCGRLDAALAGTRKAVAQLERADPAGRLPYLLGCLAAVHEERGEDDAALRQLGRAEAAAAQSGAGTYLHEINRRWRAGIHARAGRLAEAEGELGDAGELPRGWFAGDVALTRATIAARRGEHDAAAELVQRAIDAGALWPWRTRWRTTALAIPVLVEAGRPAWARELAEDALRLRPELASRARLLVLRGWLRHLEGDDALDDLLLALEEMAPEHLVRRELPRIEPLLWSALERRALAPETVVAALEAAVPGGAALLPFTRHPVPAVRRAAIGAAAASGHPDAPARIGELERDDDPAVAAAARAARDRLRRDPPTLAFTLLGGFSLRRGAHAVGDEAWGRRRRAAQRLVRFLLVHGCGPVPEEALFEAFWPGQPVDAARRSLQVTVSSARAVLEPAGSLEATDRTYRLCGRIVTDAEQFERAANDPELAAAKWGGEPLPEDRDEDWAAPWRARMTDLYAGVLGRLADARSAAGDHAGAVDAARRLVELDPLDEGAHRRLMLAYARAGRRGHALQQFLACRRALVDGLGIEPAHETAALQRRILAGEPV